MDIHKNLVILGVAVSAILIVENMIGSSYGYTLIWYTGWSVLSAVSIATGIVIGFGIKWMSMWKAKKIDDDNYDF